MSYPARAEGLVNMVEAINSSHNANTSRKDMNPVVLTPAIGNIGMATSLGE